MLSTLPSLELAKATNSECFYTSSNNFYGNLQSILQDEQYHGNVNCIGSRSRIHEGKRVAESLCFYYKRILPSSFFIARISDAY